MAGITTKDHSAPRRGKRTSRRFVPIVAYFLQIVRTQFSIPKLPAPRTSPPSSPPQLQSQADPVTQPSGTASTSSQQSTDKENAPPVTSAPAIDIPDGTLPPQILSLLTSITQTLKSYFHQYPPHTIQRLSELILMPRKHYRTLPTYLHAVDRVVHVTSGANIYPLPAAIPDAHGAKILSNGATTTGGVDPESVSWGNSATAAANLGSDESLGGALLTPITWLRKQPGMSMGPQTLSDMDGEVKTESTETIEGPNGMGSIETVSVSVNGIPSATLSSTSASTLNGDLGGGLRAEGGVTQGELLRQEQRAGVVPAAQLAGGLNRSSHDGDDVEDETPHARGPDEIGMEDMGPQGASSINVIHGMQGIDVEAAVGRRLEPEPEHANEDKPDEAMLSESSKREAEDDIASQVKRVKEDVTTEDTPVKNDDQEMELVDADGRTKDEPSFGDEGENAGADAADTSTLI